MYFENVGKRINVKQVLKRCNVFPSEILIYSDERKIQFSIVIDLLIARKNVFIRSNDTSFEY